MIATILLGGNLGNRSAYLQFAIFHIQKDIGKVVKRSSLFETEAWGGLSDKSYLNQVVQVETQLEAKKLLTTLLKIELKAGRKRSLKWGNRTLDLDILFMEDLIWQDEDLVIPHPEIHNRKFVLACLDEIIPEFKHPTIKKSIHELLDICPDPLKVQKYIQKRV